MVHIIADGNYSVVTTADGGEYMLVMQLGQIERRLAENITDGRNTFIRIGKSLIINREYITHIHPGRQKLVLSDGLRFRHEVSASREALKTLKDYVEQEERRKE